MIGEAMDSGDKSANKAMSAAQKYALLQVFCIPTEEPKDTENETHTVEPKGDGGNGGNGEGLKKPQSTSSAKPNNQDSSDKASTPQINLINSMANRTGVSVESICTVFGVESLEALTKGQVNDVLAQIKKAGQTDG
jgi:hypothetical protein